MEQIAELVERAEEARQLEEGAKALFERVKAATVSVRPYMLSAVAFAYGGNRRQLGQMCP